jgi:hypothetical protein
LAEDPHRLARKTLSWNNLFPGIEEKNMRTTALIIFLLSNTGAIPLPAQIASPSLEITKVSAAKSKSIPKFLVYRHFLAWVNDLDNKATAAGESDPYKFAQPFQRAQLTNNDLDALRKEAKALNSDLATHNQKAKMLIAEYRRTAQTAVDHGLALPPAPPEIRQLQTMQTALLVQHMVSLQSALGPEKTAQLDAYLSREFVPHLSLKPLAKPASSIPAQPKLFEP